ncbi:hypothetical protein TOTSKI_17000 [Facklamia hominis]
MINQLMKVLIKTLKELKKLHQQLNLQQAYYLKPVKMIQPLSSEQQLYQSLLD